MMNNKWRQVVTGTLFRIVTMCLMGAVFAQNPVVNLPPPDAQGWISLFRGDNPEDFYVFTGNSRVIPSQNQNPFPGGPFSIMDGDTIISAGSPLGHLIFKQPFSHFRVQFQMRWPGGIGNTGILVKVQEDDPAQSQGFPRSVECQGDPNQGIGQIWALGSYGNQNGGTWITVRARIIPHPASWAAGHQAAQFDPAAPEIDFGGVGDPYDNLIVGEPGWQQPRPAALNNGGWITVEVESHGQDTTRHFVDGQLVMEYHSPRIAPRNNANQVDKYLTEGLFAWQSEGSRVWFRNMRIQLFPEDPLYATLYPTPIFHYRALRKAAFTPVLVLEGGSLKLLVKEDRAVSLTGRLLPDHKAMKLR